MTILMSTLIIDPRDETSKDERTRELVIARWRYLLPGKRLDYIAPLIIRAVRSVEDQTLLLSLPEAVAVNVMEMTRSVSSKCISITKYWTLFTPNPIVDVGELQGV